MIICLRCVNIAQMPINVKEIFMSSGSIGIKLADNKFFPIMDDGVEGSKTLELTTVSENQDSVQIHLYRSKESSLDQTVDNAEYIGTLIIEDIAKKPAGAPTIKLKITLNGAQDLSAEASDADSGAHQSLNVSLKDLSKEAFEPLPDFDITGIDTDSEAFDFSGLDDIGLEIENYPDAEDAAGIDFGEEIKESPEEISADASLENISEDISPALDNSFSDAIDFTDSTLDFDSSDSGKAEAPETSVSDNIYDSHETARVKERKGIFIPAWLCVLILVLGIALLAAALVFAWKLFSDEGQARQSPVVAEASAASESTLFASEFGSAQPAPAPEPVSAPEDLPREASSLPVSEQEPTAVLAEEEPTPPPVWQEDAVAVAAEPAPPAIPEPAPASQNVYYLIKLGDTLWDLAETYYRNPWMYSRIAQYNNIRDPNLIIVGTYLIIPAE